MKWVTNPAFFKYIFLNHNSTSLCICGIAAIGALVVAVTVLVAFSFFIIKFLKFVKKVFLHKENVQK